MCVCECLNVCRYKYIYIKVFISDHVDAEEGEEMCEGGDIFDDVSVR